MSSEPATSDEQTAGNGRWRTQILSLLPWMWLGLSVTWAVVIFVTDQLAWPLALWIATTVGPLTALKTRLDPDPDPRPRRSNQ